MTKIGSRYLIEKSSKEKSPFIQSNLESSLKSLTIKIMRFEGQFSWVEKEV
jgi:hypothetical protein